MSCECCPHCMVEASLANHTNHASLMWLRAQHEGHRIIVDEAKSCGPRSHFTAREGCLDCDVWFNKPEYVSTPLPAEREAGK